MQMSITEDDGNKVKLQVNILKVDDDKNCIEALKLEGDRFQFNKTYHELKSYFGGHVNTTM